jgi:hypothetical protein
MGRSKFPGSGSGKSKIRAEARQFVRESPYWSIYIDNAPDYPAFSQKSKAN